MKRLSTMLFMLLCFTAMVKAQVPQMFSYQAVLRNNGEAIKDTEVIIRASLLGESISGSSVYTETHEATTSAQGVVALSIGAGDVESGDFSQIPWEDNIFLKIEVKIGSADYIEMGVSQILSVPYAIRAEKAAYADSATFADAAMSARSLQNGTIEIAPAEGHDVNAPIFSVKNADGNLVFAVYEDGVRSYVGDISDGNYGGFVVGGLAEGNPDFFVVTSDSTRVYVNETAKGPRSGFAVGGRAGQKSAGQTYFNVTPALTEVFFDTTVAKGPRSGFAVGGRSGQKSVAETYLAVTPNLTEVYFDNSTSTKGPRSGFAVGGRSGQKAEANTYLEVTPGITSVYVDESLTKGPRSGFAVGGRSGQKGNAEDIMFVSPDSTRIYINDATKGPRSGFAVGGRSGLKGTGLHYLAVTPDSTRVVVGNPLTKSSDISGFSVGGVTPSGTFKNFLKVTEQSAVFNTDLHSQGNLLVGGTVSDNVGAPLDSVADIEGNKYGAVKIGNQIWMTQNLRTKKYNDGTQIPDTTVNISEQNAAVFGGYYRWYAVENDNVCPTGWHVADSSDWAALLTHVGGVPYVDGQTVAFAGGVDKLLSPNSNWQSSTINNSTGFSVFNAGTAYFVQDTWSIMPSEMSFFWSFANSSDNNMKSRYSQMVSFGTNAVALSPISNVSELGYGIRCIKN